MSESLPLSEEHAVIHVDTETEAKTKIQYRQTPGT